MKTLLMTLCTVVCMAQSQTKKVLFVGNSYTFTNNLPQMVADMATSTGDVLIHDMSAGAGLGLDNHATNATTLQKIAAQNWDYVVLQERSQSPAFPIGYVQTFIHPNAQTLNNAILAQNPCTETVFFITWGAQNGDSQFCGVNPPSCTYESMDNLVTERIKGMADLFQGIAAPAGPVWRNIRQNYPGINLYDPDGGHPNVAGTYAAACSFYATLFRKDPTLITFDAGLPAADAAIIRQAAKTVAYDQLTAWNVGDYDPSAAFTSLMLAPGQYQFTNTSVNTVDWVWDFGDGQQSTAQNPTHTYAAPGNYTVTLTANRCGMQSTTTTTLNGVLSVHQAQAGQVAVFPNPTTGKVHLDTASPWTARQVYSSDGRLIETLGGTEPYIDLSAYPLGIYLLQFTDSEGNTVYSRVLKK